MNLIELMAYEQKALNGVKKWIINVDPFVSCAQWQRNLTLKFKNIDSRRIYAESEFL